MSTRWRKSPPSLPECSLAYSWYKRIWHIVSFTPLIILDANLLHVSLPLNTRAGMHTDTLRRRNSNLLRKIQLCFLFTFKSLFFKAFFTAEVNRSLLRGYLELKSWRTWNGDGKLISETFCAVPCSFRQVGRHAVLTKQGRCWPDAGNGAGTLKELSCNDGTTGRD